MIPEFDGYQVCKCGLVWKWNRKDPLTPSLNQRGYEQVGLTKDGHQYKRLTAYLVAEAFIPKPNARFNKVIHLDGNYQHNYIQNLAWRPDGFARQYRAQFFRERRLRLIDPIELVETGEIFETTFDAATTYGLLETAVFMSAMDSSHEISVFPYNYHFRIV